MSLSKLALARALIQSALAITFLRPRTLDTPAIQQVRDAVATGESKVHIAHRFGISRATLDGYLENSKDPA